MKNKCSKKCNISNCNNLKYCKYFKNFINREKGNEKKYNELKINKRKYKFDFIVGKSGKGQAFNPKVSNRKDHE